MIICKRIFLFSALIAIMSAFSLDASAQQSATATVSGVVKDSNAALVTGAQVIVTQKATGISRNTTSNGDGFFAITNLPAGSYEMKVQAKGFAENVIPSINLQVGQTFNLEVPLAVTVQETVTLDDRLNYDLVNTSTAVVDGVIRDFEIESLPLNGRNFLELALLVPGNSPAPNFDPTKSNTVVISSAGQLGRGGNITVDGADDNDDVVGGQVQNISQEAVQEFQIATNRFSAQLGRSGSSVINIVTKSGSNEYHGSGSFYFRNKALQGLPATFDRGLGQTPPFDRQQYAFTLGGPIQKDRAWFFGSIEYRNQDGAALVGLRDLATRTIKRTFAAAPLNDLLSTERIDWQASDQDHLFFRYSLQREDDVAPSTLDRAIGSASQRQGSINNTHSLLANYTRVLNPHIVNSFNFSFSTFFNDIEPVTPGPQLTFPSIQDGASFRVPQSTKQRRLQFGDTISIVRGNHTLNLGGEIQRVDADFDLRVFQQGRIEMIEDFPDFDRNGDGRVDDNDLLFAVTIRSGKPTESLLIPNADSTYFAGFVQDDWHVHPQLTLNVGLRYELDTDVKNISRTNQLNPIILPFLHGKRGRDTNNFGPRLGFNYSTSDRRTSIHGGYGIYYDRITLEIQSLERGLDGRALPIEVHAGPLLYIQGNPFDPVMGQFPPGAPTLANPFIGFPLTGAGAAGINIIDNTMQNPMVQQMNLGIQREFGGNYVVRADYLHNFGTHFIIGRTIGSVINPIVGGPDSVTNLESSVKTKYDGLLLSLEKRFSHQYQFRASYTLSKAFNYANDDQIPFSNGPIDTSNLQRDYGPTPNDQRHRFTFSGVWELPAGFRLAPVFTLASAVPVDILLPDGSSRVCELQRNAGARQFHTGAQLNAAIQQINAAGGSLCPNAIPGTGFAPRVLLPLVPDDVRLGDRFSSLDLRISKRFNLGEHVRIEPIAEVFNLFNVTNVLGFSKSNYSGFGNVLGSADFGRPITTAGGVFGSGGPRAFQFAARVTF
ncbi:MAG TPA: carboxypeptidase regulatory-like domain-containing protein [Pyrinomonadaceae bacterium]|nr:carboxypeptidase regulatory-like domain-containing protein [Pyrinomonadaceae bacterium]